MRPRVILNVLAILLIYLALTFYIGWNGWIWLNSVFGLEDKWFFGFLVGLTAFAYMIGHYIKKWPLFKIVGSYWMGILQYAVLLLPIANLAALVFIYFGLPVPAVVTWIGGIVLLAFILLFVYGTYNAYSPVVRTYLINIPKKVKPEFRKLRVVMASDMHFGRLSGKQHVRRLVRGVNALKPDLILLAGDIIDDDPDPFLNKNMGEIMRNLEAPLGIYGVLGNHEYYGGGIPRFLEEMQRIGITILMDETVNIKESIYLVGRKDKTDAKRLSMNELIKDLASEIPLIMMDHQPAEISQAEQNGVDLLLSGHTHRGQMAPNHLITRKVFELDWGYLQKNQLHAIVSSGFGFWGPPIRIGSRSEIIQIDITFSE